MSRVQSFFPALPELSSALPKFQAIPNLSPLAARAKRSRRSNPQAPELTDEERESILRKAYRHTASGAIKTATILDKPGSTVRDIIGGIATGNWDKYNPLDQWIPGQLTDPSQQVEGRELFKDLGLAGNKNTWGNFGAGLAYEIAADPLTYLTGGASALNKTGKLFRAAGLGGKMNKIAKAGVYGPRSARMLGTGQDIIGGSFKQLATGPTLKPGKKMLKGINSGEMLSFPELRRLRRAAQFMPEFGKDVGKTRVRVLRDLYDQADKPLGAAYRAGLPQWRMFGEKGISGSSPHVLANKFMGIDMLPVAQGMDRALSVGKHLPAPVRAMGRRVHALFDPEGMGAVNPEARKLGYDHRLADAEDMMAVRQQITRLRRLWKDPDVQDYLKDYAAQNDVLDHAGNFRPDWAIRHMMENVVQNPQFMKTLPPKVANAVKQPKKVLDELLANQQKLGVKIQQLDDDYSQYFPRQMFEGLQQNQLDEVARAIRGERPGAALSAFDRFSIGRNPLLANIKQGSVTIQKMLSDPDLLHVRAKIKAGELPPDRLAEAIKTKYGHRIPKEYRSKPMQTQVLAGPQPMTIEDIYSDPTIKALRDDVDRLFSELGSEQQIAEAYGKLNDAIQQKFPEAFADSLGGNFLTAPMAMSYSDRHKALAQFMMQLPDEVLKTELFGNHPLLDFEQRLLSGTRSMRAAKLLRDAFTRSGRHGRIAEEAFKTGKGKHLTVGQIVEQLGDLDKRRFAESLLENRGYNRETMMSRAAGGQARKGGGLESAAADTLGSMDDPAGIMQAANRGGKSYDDMLDDVLRQKVNPEIARDLLGMGQKFSAPANVNPIVKFTDDILNLFKTQVTTPMPSFHSRNLVSGAIQNMVMFGLSPVKYLKNARDAQHIMQGKTVKGISKIPQIAQRVKQQGLELTDETATRVAREMAYENDLITRSGAIGELSHTGETGEAQVGNTNRLDMQIPGEIPQQLKKQIWDNLPGRSGKNAGTYWVGGPGNAFFGVDPIAGIKKAATLGRSKDSILKRPVWSETQGVFGSPRTKWAPAKIGEELSYRIEGVNRLAPWLEEMRRGSPADAAARRVGEVQIRYDKDSYTPFEQQVMRRTVPFYSFMSRSIPETAKYHYRNPSGMLGQGLRAARISTTKQPLPEHVADTLAIPADATGFLQNPEDPTTQRYLTGLGLMNEDAWDILGNLGSITDLAGGEMPDIGFEMLSRLRPELKLPLEASFNESLFQRGPGGGRELESMDPLFSRTAANTLQTASDAANWVGDKTGIDMLKNRDFLAEATSPEEAAYIKEHGFSPNNYMFNPLLGKTLSQGLERFGANYPIFGPLSSRGMSELRKLTDPRKQIPIKALNALSGLKVSDISRGAREKTLREYLDQFLKESGARTFSRPYIPDDFKAQLSDQERELVRLLEGVYREIDRNVKASGKGQPIPYGNY